MNLFRSERFNFNKMKKKNYFSVLTSSKILQEEGKEVSLVIEILKVYNCRVQEVLNATWEDFFPGKMLILKGLKKSANIIVRDRIILSCIAQLYKWEKDKIFPNVNKQKVQRAMLRHYPGIVSAAGRSKRRRITHAWRYLAARIVQDEKQTQDILHHRSVKSQSYYKSKKGNKK